MRMLSQRVLLAMGAGVACLLAIRAQSTGSKPLYLDPGQPIEKRVEDLLGRMTLSEKVGQMNMPCVYKPALGSTIPLKLAACRKFTAGTYVEGIGPGGGFFTLANEILTEGTRQQAEYFNELQKIAVEGTRLKIPVLQSEEGTHGVMCSGSTIFPEGLAIGSTWNMDLVRRVYASEAQRARAVGIHQLYTLVIEPLRDPRMGRNQEGYSEDPYMCSRIAETIVRAAQGNDVSAPDKVVAGLCAYPGQSEPISGLERGAMELSERKLQSVFLPPWRAGITKAGGLGVMATYPAIDDVPTHDSERLLSKILRDDLGFRGLLLSEGLGISTLEDEKVVDNQKEAGAFALKAGVDVGISFEPAYMKLLIENVNEGKAPMELIDRAVRHILTQKFRLGLFERPYVDPEHAAKGLPVEQNRQLALQVAREGIVLLKNETHLLPLRKDLKRIAVIGPNADVTVDQLGDYNPHSILQEIVSVRKGIERKLPQTQVLYVKGCDHMGGGLNEIQAARDAAGKADVAVVVLGESFDMDGEGKDMANLDLPAMQEELVKAVSATGTPTVVVLINGRPLSTRWIAENVPAVVEAWRPGEQGGNAVADVLFGDFNPSGRLAITVPRHVGQLPVYYNHKVTKHTHQHYVDMPVSPLYPFGYGLSYTRFQYGGLKVEPQRIRPDGEVRVSLEVKNVGDRAGQEVVQLYLRDVLSSVSRPVKELRGFEKVGLQPGEVKTVQFRLGFEDLSLLDRNMKRVVEPGQFRVMIGSSSEDVRLSQFFDVE